MVRGARDGDFFYRWSPVSGDFFVNFVFFISCFLFSSIHPKDRVVGQPASRDGTLAGTGLPYSDLSALKNNSLHPGFLGFLDCLYSFFFI